MLERKKLPRSKQPKQQIKDVLGQCCEQLWLARDVWSRYREKEHQTNYPEKSQD